MAGISLKMGDTAQESQGLRDSSATFEKMKSLLKAKDDTSRFVGLALLKTVLDNGQLTQDPERLRNIWEALSPKFLDRLLRSYANEKVQRAEARDMVDLAVAVLHTFTILLPENSRLEKRLIGRTGPLLKALVESPPETTKLILQTLLTIVSQPEGALELLSCEDVSSLTEIAPEYPLVLDIMDFTWTNASTIESEVHRVRKTINKVMPAFLIVFQDTDAVTFLTFVGSVLPKLVPEALSQDPKWLGNIVSVLRKLVTSRPTLSGRAAYTQLAAALLQVFPTNSPSLLFRDDISGNSDGKPFSYLFINLLLIDLRSSFPSLLSQLNSDGYAATSQRLAAAFDVISSFIVFLVRSLDDDSGESTLIMPPDLILKLRKDIAETVSLTIEYLRDRWDASVAGAPGLHSSARAGSTVTSEGTRLTLTWESMQDKVNGDLLILAGIRTLAIWIREDENENLRNESAGLMDMILELYKTSSPESLDFRYPLLLALEGILVTEGGVDAFLGQDGWETTFQDLESIIKSIAIDGTLANSAKIGHASRGLEIVRVLLAVLDHTSTSSPRESWMAALVTTSSMKPPSPTSPALIIELQIGMIQLSTALLSKAPLGMQKRFATSVPPISKLAAQLEVVVKDLDDNLEATEFMSLLEDVNLDLENLRITT